jgi:hypothetical protein
LLWCALVEIGNSATFRVVAEQAGGRLFLWLEPAMNPDEVVTFYRITEQGVAPSESWRNFQQGDTVGPYAGKNGTTLGAVEMLASGQYTVDARIFTGFETIDLPGIEVELREIAEDPVNTEARAAFNASFTALFRKFFEYTVTDGDVREYFAGFDKDQLDFLIAAIIDLGAPEDYPDDDETRDISGFFDFIDYACAVAQSCGDSALDLLSQYPDSPTHRHYIHYVKQCLADERLLSAILEKYPFCSR